MGYQRETFILRATGGHRAGFLIWERGARQASLRCNLDELLPEEELSLFWMAEGSFALREDGRLRADASGMVRHTVPIAGDRPPVAVALARDSGALYAYAFAQGMADAPERLQALLLKEEPKKEPDLSPIQAQAQPLQEARLQEPLWLEALRRGIPWPPPPGLPGVVWRDGGWTMPV
ncbi:MAG: hypothetical protein FWD25_04205 [Clostridia bacterium]|nr:hypothetical protein [Clostridia bacterium]